MVVHDFLLQQRSARVKELAASLEFDACGISRAGFLEEEAPRLEKWLSQNYQGTMKWMENHFDKRLDPTLLVEGARSVISVLLNYYPQQEQPSTSYKIAKYAYGEDYHFVFKSKLKSLLQSLEEHFGAIHGRVFVDSAPVMDKAWAERSGLGWVGKNSNLISPKTGSFFLIGEIILDLDLAPDHAIQDYCGTCTRCLDACPTDAIAAPYVVDGSKCISYFTIELKESIPEAVKGTFDDWIFGCDICQDVCPWNRFSRPHSHPEFTPKPELLELSKTDWEALTEDAFRELFRKSPLKRAKFEGIRRTIAFIKDKGPEV